MTEVTTELVWLTNEVSHSYCSVRSWSELLYTHNTMSIVESRLKNLYQSGVFSGSSENKKRKQAVTTVVEIEFSSSKNLNYVYNTE